MSELIKKYFSCFTIFSPNIICNFVHSTPGHRGPAKLPGEQVKIMDDNTVMAKIVKLILERMSITSFEFI